ncbi:MAG: hypothetical protein PVI35_06585 [Acidimicrobiia bacterium]|jgi:hypothetical protein
MRRIERRLFRLNDQIAALRRDEVLARQELEFHVHLNDDATRDALVSDAPLDRADARETAGDVARFEAHIARLEERRRRLEERRDRLLGRLGG